MKYSKSNPPMTCMMTQSTCYKGTKKMTVKSVLWHSTGAKDVYKRQADLVAFQRREARARKRLSGDPRNPFRPRYGAELTFTAAAQEAEALGYILKLLEKEAARECARRVIPTLDAILDFVIGFGLQMCIRDRPR